MFTHSTLIKIIGAISALAVIAGISYAVITKSPSKSGETKTAQTEGTAHNQQPASSGKKMAFADFLKQGGAYQCTVNQYVQDIESKGKVYIDGGRISGVFSTKVQGMTIDTNILVRDGYSYTWSSMMQGIGYKIKTVDPKDVPTSSGASTSGTYSFNAEQIGDYNCTPWSVDESTFSVPANVTFKTL